MTDNAADFPPLSVATTQAAIVTNAVNAAEAEGAEQQAGFGEAAQQFEVKATARENLREDMSVIARTARSMEYAFDGISDKFRMPRNATDQTLLAAGRAFLIEIPVYKPDMIAYGLPAGFDADLLAACDAFEASFTATASATDEHVEATADIAESIRLGVQAVRVLDGIVRNTYASDTGKTAAWASASHVEKDPKKAPPPTP
jgi:hypothetical protein